MEQYCHFCKFLLTPETKITTFDANENMLVVCQDKMACIGRVRQAEHLARMLEDKPQIDENDRLREKFGHLPKEEQLKAMFNLEMKDFFRTTPTRGGCVYYELPDGTKYIWEIFEKYWHKAIVREQKV